MRRRRREWNPKLRAEKLRIGGSEVVHPPLVAVEHTGGASRWRSTDAWIRHAIIAIVEEFTDDDINASSSGRTVVPQPNPFL